MWLSKFLLLPRYPVSHISICVLFCSPGVSHPYLFNIELFSVPQISHAVPHLRVFIVLFHPPVFLFSPSWVTSTHPSDSASERLPSLSRLGPLRSFEELSAPFPVPLISWTMGGPSHPQTPLSTDFPSSFSLSRKQEAHLFPLCVPSAQESAGS